MNRKRSTCHHRVKRGEMTCAVLLCSYWRIFRIGVRVRVSYLWQFKPYRSLDGTHS